MPILTRISNCNNNNNCNCGCNNIVVRRQRNNITTQNARIAQFSTVGSQVIDTNENIVFTNTQFNNISSNVQLNNNGTVELLTQGVYKLEYVAVVQNNLQSTVNAILTLQSDAVNLNVSQSIVTLESSQYAILTNQLILPVFSGTTRTISLTNISGQEITVTNANIIITKLV